jgi:hypothetical protein
MPTYNGLAQGVDPVVKRPALAALAALAAPPRSDEDSFGMRPSLRNALADTWGEKQLSDLQDLQPTVFHRPGSAAVPGVFGQPMDETYDPENDAPVAALERGRQEARLNADQSNTLHDIYDPLATMRAGRSAIMSAADEDVAKSIGAQGDLSRYWDPSNQARVGQEFEQKRALAVEPAQAAATGRTGAADTAAWAKVQAALASQKPQDFAKMFDEISNTYPRDPRTGEAQLPPEMKTLRDYVMSHVQAGVGGGPTALTSQDPREQAFIDSARKEGYGDAEISAYLQKKRAGG